jgi:hypothetical protein
MGTWEHIEAGTCLVEHDKMLARLSVIVSGKADVRLDGEKVAELATASSSVRSHISLARRLPSAS